MSKVNRIFDRHAESKVKIALKDTRVIGLVGPRQSGKTTLAEQIAREYDMSFFSLDEDRILNLAVQDPDGFFRTVDRAVVDEIQRAPGITLALKYSVDHDQRPGRFIVTGSVDFFRSALSPDSLAGRIEFVELLPLSQSEIEQKEPSDFLERAFSNDFPKFKTVGFTSELVERVVRGGYPVVINRSSLNRQREWLRAYSETLVERNIQEIARINKVEKLSGLLDRMAVYAGQVTNLKKIAVDLSVDEKTIDQWIRLFEQMFIVRRVPAWYRNKLKRLNKSPKLHFLDSGLLASLQKVDVESIREDRHLLGQLLENFVFSELYKLGQQKNRDISIFHYREQSKFEIDFVLEKAHKIVGIEVKATTGIKSEDFKALKRLREYLGATFVCGIVLHDGNHIHCIEENLYAMPISMLWNSASH